MRECPGETSSRSRPGNIFALSVVLAGCTTTPTTDPTTTTTTTATEETPSTTAPTVEPPQHRLGVRQVDGVGEFYDTTTGQRFTPTSRSTMWSWSG